MNVASSLIMFNFPDQRISPFHRFQITFRGLPKLIGLKSVLSNKTSGILHFIDFIESSGKGGCSSFILLCFQ